MSQDPASFDGIFPGGFGPTGAGSGAAGNGADGDGGTDIDTLLQTVDDMPYGTAGRSLLDDALNVAREEGLEADEYRIRMHLIAFAEMGGDVDGVLSNFAWCVAHNEEDPARFPTSTDGCDLLWYYKWVPDTLAANPNFSRSDVLAALDSMEDRYRRDGVGLSAVYQARFAEAAHAGFAQEAEHWRELLATTDRDDYSHCEACSRAELVSYYLGLGDNEEALKYFDEIVAGGYSCGEEPESVMAQVMVPLLEADRAEDAVQAHRISYRLARENPALTPVLAQHAEFCAITGNHARALTLVERHLPWLAHDDLDAAAHFAVLVPLSVACGIVARAGHADLPVRGSEETRVREVLGRTDSASAAERLTVAELAAASEAKAEVIGLQFDERNGTDHYAQRLEGARADAQLSFDVPLGSPEQFPMQPAVGPAPDDADGWADAATWGLVAGDADRVRDAVKRGLTADPTPRQALLLWGALADLSTDLAHEQEEQETQSDEADDGEADGGAGDNPDLTEALGQRAALYRELGLDEEADFELAHGRLTFDYLDDDDAQQAADLLSDIESPELRARLMYVVANFARARGNQEAAKEGFVTAAARAQLAGDDYTYARALVGACWATPIDAEHGEELRELLEQAQAAGPRANQVYDLAYINAVAALAVDDDPDTALQLARRAADVALANRAGGPLRQITGFRADLLTRLDRHLEAARAQHVYNRMLDEQDHGVDLDTIVSETRELLLADQPEEALEAIDPVAQLIEDSPEIATPGELAVAQYWRAVANEAVGAFQLAFAYWLSALETGEAAWESQPEHPDAQRAALHASLAVRRLTNLAVRAQESDDVRTLGRRALTLAAALEPLDNTFVPVTQQDVGRAFVEIGDSEAGLELLRAAEEGHAELGADWFAADARDVRGRALAAGDQPDEAIPVLLSAADAYRDADDTINAALSEFAAAVILRGHDRDEEATVLLSSALDVVKDQPSEARTAIATVYADILSEQGNTAQAQHVRGYIE